MVTHTRFLLRVLLVGDSDDMLAQMRRLLQKIGITSVQSANPTEAFSTAIMMKPDLVIMDADGAARTLLNVAVDIRRSAGRHVAMAPILLLTGTTDRDLVEAARDAGISAVLLKPVISTTLRQRIDSVVNQPRRFIRTPAYAGPCRRRRADPQYAGPERRNANDPA